MEEDQEDEVFRMCLNVEQGTYQMAFQLFATSFQTLSMNSLQDRLVR